jgi:hypothetical protein
MNMRRGPASVAHRTTRSIGGNEQARLSCAAVPGKSAAERA